jgi:hypothetical protein
LDSISVNNEFFLTSRGAHLVLFYHDHPLCTLRSLYVCLLGLSESAREPRDESPRLTAGVMPPPLPATAS